MTIASTGLLVDTSFRPTCSVSAVNPTAPPGTQLVQCLGISYPCTGGFDIHTALTPLFRLAGALGNTDAVGIHVCDPEVRAGYGAGLRAKIAPLTLQIRTADGRHFHVQAQCFSRALLNTDPAFVHFYNVECSPCGAHFRGLQVRHICFARAGITDQTTPFEQPICRIGLSLAPAHRSAFLTPTVKLKSTPHCLTSASMRAFGTADLRPCSTSAAESGRGAFCVLVVRAAILPTTRACFINNASV
jgi:hypothetical protein